MILLETGVSGKKPRGNAMTSTMARAGKSSQTVSNYPTKNQKLINWVQEAVDLCKPDNVYWCDGTEVEYNRLCSELVEQGTLIRLNPEKGQIVI